MRAHYTGCEFESYTCPNKNTIGEEGSGKSPHKIHFCRKKLRALSLISVTLEIESAMQDKEMSQNSDQDETECQLDTAE